MTELSMKERDFKCKFIGKRTTTHTVLFITHKKREKEEKMREVIKKNWQLVLQIPFQFSRIIYYRDTKWASPNYTQYSEVECLMESQR